MEHDSQHVVVARHSALRLGLDQWSLGRPTKIESTTYCTERCAILSPSVIAAEG